LEYQLGDEEKDVDAKQILDSRFLKHFNLNWSSSDPDWTLKSTRLMEPQYEDYLLAEGHKIILSNTPLYVWIHARRTIVFFIESSASRSYGALVYGLSLPAKIFYPFLDKNTIRCYYIIMQLLVS